MRLATFVNPQMMCLYSDTRNAEHGANVRDFADVGEAVGKPLLAERLELRLLDEPVDDVVFF